MARKRVRKNYYKNSRAKGKARIVQRIFFWVKLGSIVAVLGGISFLCILAHDALVQSKYFMAETITVEGNFRLSRKAVLKQSAVALGDNILNVNLKVLRHRLLANPWVAAADVKRELPDTIHIRIREQVPVAIVKLDRPFLLNASGEIFKVLQPGETVHVPVVDGLQPADVDPRNLRLSRSLRAVLDAVQLTRHHESLIPTGTIQRIHVDPELGLTLRGVDQGMAVTLGFGDYASKFDRLKEMVAYLSSGNQLLQVGAMDLNDMDRVVIRPAGREPVLEVCYRKEM